MLTSSELLKKAAVLRRKADRQMDIAAANAYRAMAYSYEMMAARRDSAGPPAPILPPAIG